jgi:hypothetical protein
MSYDMQRANWFPWDDLPWGDHDPLIAINTELKQVMVTFKAGKFMREVNGELVEYNDVLVWTYPPRKPMEKTLILAAKEKAQQHEEKKND